MTRKPKVGDTYRHYKGKTYKIVAIGRHHETLEEWAVYEGQYTSEEFGANPVWIRPISMFTEVIVREGKEMKRFELIL